MLWITMLFGCGASESVPTPAPAGPYWVKRSEGELQVALRDACGRAVARSAPVLLVFSAPWCGDCQQLRKLGDDPELAGELAEWEKVVVDVGRFDRHPSLIGHFGIGGIAYQVALRPTDCTTDVTSWPVLAAGTFEVGSNPDGPRTAADVTAWLRNAR